MKLIAQRYFAFKSTLNAHLELNFLLLAQSLESLYDVVEITDNIEGNFNPSDEWKYNLLSNLTDEIERKWLKSRLDYVENKPDFRKRLHLLVKHFIPYFCTSANKRKSLINRIVDVRNNLTHPQSIQSQQEMSKDMMMDLVTVMDVLVMLHFLKIIGFSDEMLQTVTEQTSNNKFAQKLKICREFGNA